MTDSQLRAMRPKQGSIAMNEVMNPTKEDWLKSTSELLVQYEKKIAAWRRQGSEIPRRRLDVVSEIRSKIEQRSKWTETEFHIWRNAPSPGEVGYEEYLRDYPHLQNLWDE